MEIIVKLSLQDCDVVLKGLLELQGKVMLETLRKFDEQVQKQIAENKTKEV